jgi:predicted RNA-binding protein with PIN domain
MAIQTVIIDGYNFIKNTAEYRCDWASIQSSKDRLSEALYSFNRNRNHSITVVYDGWKNGGSTESYEKIGGIHVIHSRKGETADKVIMRLCQESPGNLLVVTADREIISAVIQNGGQAVNPAEFHNKISRSSTSTAHDYAAEVDNDPAYSRPTSTRKKGPSHRVPKAKRKRRALLDGL